MSGCFKSWLAIYASCLATLRPGGFIEIIDFEDWVTSPLILSFSPTSPLHNFLGTVLNCCAKMERPFSMANVNPQTLSDSGFVECQAKTFRAPVGGKGMGQLWLLSILEGFEALGLRILTREAGWSVQKVMETCEELREELMDIVKNAKGRGLSIGVQVLTGRKPWTDEKGKGKEHSDN